MRPDQTVATRTTGLILAGGRSRRMGTDKAFVRLAGKPLIRHVIDCLAPQVSQLAISSNAPAQQFSQFGVPVLADIHVGFQGPLAGIHAGLCVFPDDTVVSVAVDLPFLPFDLVTRLHDGWDGRRCRYLLCADRPALAILWPARSAPALEQFLRHDRRVSDWLARHGQAVEPSLSGAALDINVNTPADLARAETFQGQREVRGHPATSGMAHPAR